ncbi:MAG: hypothetical protein ACE15F_04085 [bacterium]
MARRNSPVSMSWWMWGLVIGIMNLPGWPEEAGSPASSPDIKPVTGSIILRNDWIRAEIHPAGGGRVEQMYAHEDPLLWPLSGQEAHEESWLGASLVLYASHPLSSTATIGWVSQEEAVCQPGGRSAVIRSVYERQLKINREFAVGNLESVLRVTTTITNPGGAPVVFFPSEAASINTEYARSGMPNINLYFYSPYSTLEGSKPFEITLGLVNNPQFAVMPEHSLFIARNAHRIGEIKLTSEKNWFAFQNLISHAAIQGGTVCAAEFTFPGVKPEPVRDNLILHVNGAGEYIGDGKLRFNSPETAKYMRATRVLGRVELQPGASFTYVAAWSMTSCEGPIVDVRDGIVFNKHLVVYLPPNRPGFLNYANLGIPQEGNIGFQYLGANNEVFKITEQDGRQKEHLLTIPLILEATKEKSRPSRVVPFLPTPIHHFTLVFFSEEQLNAGPGELQKIQDAIHSIRMMLVDSKQKPIRVLDEVSGPFPVSTEELQF